MKKLTQTVFTAALLFVSAMASFAQVLPPRETFAITATGATLSSAIVTANGKGPMVATYVSATSDKAASVLQFYKATGAQPITASAASGQPIVAAVGTSFTGSAVVVLRHVATDTYERLIVSASTSTNITFTANLGAAVVAGDVVYLMAASGTVPVGAATKEIISTAGLYHAPGGFPLLIDLDSTSAGKINLITGYFRDQLDTGFRTR